MARAGGRRGWCSVECMAGAWGGWPLGWRAFWVRRMGRGGAHGGHGGGDGAAGRRGRNVPPYVEADVA